MAAKVQDAIEHNKRIFEQRMRMEVRGRAAVGRLLKRDSSWAGGALCGCAPWAVQSTPRPNPCLLAWRPQERSLLKRAFQAWQARRAAAAAKRRRLDAATARLQRGALARALFAWRYELHMVDRTLAMKRKVGRRAGGRQ
jgi:hypothetical protein